MADLRLDKFQPGTHNLWLFADQEQPILLPATFPIQTMLMFARLDGQMRDAQGGGGDAQVQLMEQMYEAVMEPIRRLNPGVKELPLTMEDLDMILETIMSGEAPTEYRPFNDVLAEQVSPPEGANGEDPTKPKAKAKAKPRSRAASTRSGRR